MDKEKQDRFDCKHLECCMDGCYCSAGHGSKRGYGHCVIPYEQKTCAYFERKPKTKTVKITKNEVVISKEEWKHIKNSLYYSKEELEKKLQKTRKETAREILTFIGNMYDECDSRFKLKDYQWHKDLCKQYGVEIGE